MAIKEETKDRILVGLANNLRIGYIAKTCGVSLRTVYHIKNSSADFIKDYLTIKDLINNKKYKKALKICSLEKWCNSGAMQYQKVKILIEIGGLDKALEICNLDKWQDNGAMQHQKIKILIRTGRLEEALAICNLDIWQKNKRTQSQKITILIKLRRYNEALEICNLDKWQNIDVIQSQKVTILTKLGRLEEALEICNLEIWKANNLIRRQKRKILKTLEQEKDLNNEIKRGISELELEREHTLEDITACVRKIRDKSLTLDEIEVLNVSAEQKAILLVAFYEANNYHRDVILNYLKKLSKDYNDSKEMLAIIKKLMNRIKMQKRFFDIGFYEKILDVLSKISIIKIEQERNGLLALKDNLEVLSSNNIKGR